MDLKLYKGCSGIAPKSPTYLLSTNPYFQAYAIFGLKEVPPSSSLPIDILFINFPGRAFLVYGLVEPDIVIELDRHHVTLKFCHYTGVVIAHTEGRLQFPGECFFQTRLRAPNFICL